ncbi:MAG: hypothetical protein C0508_07610 [Cyanobacteria bacterium PR.023]|nr:hypothetical protein [Cyanobacteria bacterium PR.023]
MVIDEAEKNNIFHPKEKFLLSICPYWLLPLLSSVFIAILFQTRIFDYKALLFADSSGYLVDASTWVDIIRAVAHGQFDLAWRLASAVTFVDKVLLDGPVIPLFGAMAFFLTGKEALSTNWLSLVILLALLNGFCAAGVSVLAHRLACTKRTAVVTGLLFGLYPGTIAASGRFLTEPIVAMLLVAIALLGSNSLTISGKRGNTITLLSMGILTGIGVLLKPVILPVLGLLAVLPLFLASIQKPSRLAGQLLVLSFGVTLVVGSWTAYYKAASGHWSVVPQRVPLINITIGHDLDSDSWFSAIGPYGCLKPTGTSLGVLVSAWKKAPLAVANLYVRKISRTMGFVWNDLKFNIYGLDVAAQNWIHALLASLSVMGILLMVAHLLTSFKTKLGDENFAYICLAILTVIFGNAIMYAPFEANTRCGFMSVPFMFCAAAFFVKSILQSKSYGQSALLAAAAISSVVALKLNLVSMLAAVQTYEVAILEAEIIRGFLLCLTLFLLFRVFANSFGQLSLRKYSITLCAAIFTVFVLAPALLTTAHMDDNRCFAVNLADGQSVVRRLNLPSANSQGSTARYFLMVDGDWRCDDAKCLVNGVQLNGRFISVNKLDSSAFWSFDGVRTMSLAMDIPIAQMRQWRVMPLPPNLLKVGTENVLEVSSSKAGLTIYGDRFATGEHQVRLPAISCLALTRPMVCDPVNSIEARLPALLVSTTSSSSSTRNSQGALTPMRGQARVFILRVEPMPEMSSDITASLSNSLSSQSEKQNTVSINANQFDPTMTNGVPAGWVRNNRYTLSQAATTGVTFTIPADLPSHCLLEVKVTGELLSAGRNNKAGLFMAVNSDGPSKASWIFPEVPPYLIASNKWSSFEIVDQLNQDAFKERIDRFFLMLLPGRPEQIMKFGMDRTVGSFFFRNIKVTFRPLSLPDLSKSVLKVF